MVSGEWNGKKRRRGGRGFRKKNGTETRGGKVKEEAVKSSI